MEQQGYNKDRSRPLAHVRFMRATPVTTQAITLRQAWGIAVQGALVEPQRGPAQPAKRRLRRRHDAVGVKGIVRPVRRSRRPSHRVICGLPACILMQALTVHR